MTWAYLILVVGILTAGCGEQIMYQRFDKGMWSSYVRLNEVKPGMTKTEVLGIMGPPVTTESGDYRGGHYTVFFYLTHSMDFDESNTVRGGYAPWYSKVTVWSASANGITGRRLTARKPGGMPAGSLPWSRTQ